MLDLPHEVRVNVVTLYTWLPAGALHVDMGFLADPLSITMCLFVTGIATLIHLFSMGYMAEERGEMVEDHHVFGHAALSETATTSTVVPSGSDRTQDPCFVSAWGFGAEATSADGRIASADVPRATTPIIPSPARALPI